MLVYQQESERVIDKNLLPILHPPYRPAGAIRMDMLILLQASQGAKDDG